MHLRFAVRFCLIIGLLLGLTSHHRAIASGDSCSSVVAEPENSLDRLTPDQIIQKAVYGVIPNRKQQTRSLYDVESLKLMSMNMENALTYRGGFIKELTEKFKYVLGKRKRPKERDKVRSIARVINEEQPDIIAIQEVDGEISLELLIKKYLKPKGAYNYAVFPGNDFRGVEVAVLYRNDLNISIEYKSHAVERHQNEILTMEEPLFSRDLGMLYVFANEDIAVELAKDELSETDLEPNLVFGVGHYKSRYPRKGDPNSKSLRGAQIKRTIEITDEIEEEFADTPIFIGADWNINFINDEDGEADELLSEDGGFIDPFDLTGLANSDRVTHVWFPDEESGLYIQSQLDAILVKNVEPKALEGGIIDSRVAMYFAKNGRRHTRAARSRRKLETQGGDHYGVVLEVKSSILHLPNRDAVEEK